MPTLIQFYIDVEVKSHLVVFISGWSVNSPAYTIAPSCSARAVSRGDLGLQVTGGHNQFYDKFTYRHYMATLLLHVCQYPPYLESVSAFVRGPKTQETFVRFVSMMLNDAIYCIDESLLKLAEIRKAQQQVAAPDFASRPEEERREIEQVFQKLNSTSGHTVCQAAPRASFVGDLDKRCVCIS